MGVFGAAWGVSGVIAILVIPIIRLWVHVDASLQMELEWWHLAGYAASLAFMAWSEGYRGFQKGFSPRVVARAQVIADEPRALRVVLAPLFCMGFFGATRRRLLATWILTAAIVGFIVALRFTPQPWRGIVDAGVILGLGWGVVTIALFAVSALRGHAMPVEPDVA